MLIGTANPTLNCERSISVVMPITSPREFSSGPPELPGLIAASVWMMSIIGRPSGASIDRPRPLTTPDGQRPLKPNGLPMASAIWPTSSVDESPSVTGRRRSAGASTLSTAMSFRRRGRRTSAGTFRPSASVTSIRVGVADDVVVGQDVPLIVDHEARSRSPGAGRALAGRVRHADRDVDHRWRHPLEQVRDQVLVHDGPAEAGAARRRRPPASGAGVGATIGVGSGVGAAADRPHAPGRSPSSSPAPIVRPIPSASAERDREQVASETLNPDHRSGAKRSW